MKKSLYLIVTCCLIATATIAQTINYQGIARNAQGAPLANSNIAVKLSIKDAASGGNTLYSEAKSINTNAFGLYNISINDGSGTRTGDFNSINWSAPRYLQTEIDPANGSAFVDMGTSLMQSVPMAIVAKNLEGVVNPQEGDMLVFKNSQWQKKPQSRKYKAAGLGANPFPDLRMLSSPVITVVENDNPILRISLQKIFGSIAAGGGVGLALTLGYRRVDIPGQLLTAFELGGLAESGLTGIRVAIGTRSPISFSGTYTTTLPKGTYEIGIIGAAGNQANANSWNDNGPSFGTVEVDY